MNALRRQREEVEEEVLSRHKFELLASEVVANPLVGVRFDGRQRDLVLFLSGSNLSLLSGDWFI